MNQESQFERAGRELYEHIQRTRTPEYQAMLARLMMNAPESSQYRELQGNARGLLEDIFGFRL